jgi:hypothetical protein
MKLKFLQEGGVMAPEQAAQGGGEAPAQQGGPEEQLMQMAGAIIQQLGPEAAAMLAQMIVQMLQEGAAQPQGQPQFARKGGKLVYNGRK